MAVPRLVVALGLLAVAAPAAAQPALRADAPRVLFAVTDDVKTDSGERAQVTRTLTYFPLRGEYVDETVDAAGAVLARRVSGTSVAAPTPREMEAARALVAGHPEIAPRIADAAAPVQIVGGFPLVREAGHPCGPGGRCVTLEVYETPPGERARRIRYTIVDLRTLTVLDPDADAEADGNLANPAARRHSTL